MKINTVESLAKNFEVSSKNLGYASRSINQQLNKLYDGSIQNLGTTVIEEAPNGNLISYDVYTRLLKDRIIFFDTVVAPESCNVAIAQLLFLEMADPKKDITMMISTGGGSVSAGLALTGTMNYISNDVETIIIDTAASMGAIISSSAVKGKRFALPDARFMIHQVSSQMGGTLSSMEISLKEAQKYKNRLYTILAENSGQTFEQIEEKCKEDCWMSVDEAIEGGFIDKKLKSKKDKK